MNLNVANPEGADALKAIEEAQTLMESGDTLQLKSAEKLLRPHMEAYRSDYLPPATSRVVYITYSMVAEKLGNYEEMKKLCDEMLQKTEPPDQAPFYRLLSEYYLHAKDTEQAYTYASKAFHAAKKYNYPDFVWYYHHYVIATANFAYLKEDSCYVSSRIRGEINALKGSLSHKPNKHQRNAWIVATVSNILRYRPVLLYKMLPYTGNIIKQMFSIGFWRRFNRWRKMGHA